MHWKLSQSPPRNRSIASRDARCTALALVLLLGACAPLPSPKAQQEIPTEDENSSEVRVQVDAPIKPLSEGQVAETKSENLLPDVQHLLGQKRAHSARAFVQRRPDMALETLRSRIGHGEDSPALLAIASAYDEQLRLAQNGWTPLVNASQDKAVQAYAEARRRMHDALRHGASVDKASAELARAAAATGSPMVALDQLHLSGLGALVTDQPRQAIAIFERACQQAMGVDPYQEVQLALLLSDALRRAGQIEPANRTWAKGVTNAALLVDSAGLFDPVYWDRASYLRPIAIAWPPEALATLAKRSRLDIGTPVDQLDPGDAEAIVWEAIAQGLLERGDHQSALVAAKRAEVATTDMEIRGWIRLTQAEALACVDQIPAATAILVSLTTSRDARLKDAATATLGGMKLRSGDANAGFRLLVKALEQKTPPEWPGRAKAEADLGLALLMRNDDANGLKWLHSAQSRFAHEGDILDLSQSLWNEAAYLKQAKRKSDEVDVQNRLADLEREPSTLHR